jgi:DNA-binding PadR family transcriptional regulator
LAEFTSVTRRNSSRKGAAHPSPLHLILLGMLFEEPMHAYRMQKLIKQRGLDTVVSVPHRASVYHALERLLLLGLIEVRERIRIEGELDRIVYGISALGSEMAVAWLRKTLSIIGADRAEFPAAVSMLTMLSPDDVRKHLGLRVDAVRNELKRLNIERRAAHELPRLRLLKEEYRIALLNAELAWIRSLIADLTRGSFAWHDQRP